MSQSSDIEWTDATWNPVRGCTKVSPGCANCYAETFAERWRGVPGHAYEYGFDLRLVYEKLDEPLRWTKPRKVFVNSMSDLFQDGVPDAFILMAFAVMANARQHTFQVLTKRPERMRAFIEQLRWMVGFGVVEISGRPHLLVDLPVINGDEWERIGGGHRKPIELRRFVPPNIWLGVSVENQHFADERIPLLLQTPAAVRFISAEPLLEAIDVRRYLASNDAVRPGIDWLIIGAESGHGARNFDVQWARDLKEQVDCSMGATKLFVKQLGAKPVIGPAATLRLKKKGGDMSEWPSDLRVREFPAGRA